MTDNITWHDHIVNRHDREERLKHKACCLWFTGLSGSGKSSIAMQLERILFERNVNVFVLDGDNVRRGLNKDLDFSPGGRKENIRRISETAKLFVDAGFIIITTFISPFTEDRNKARKLFSKGEFVEVFVDCNIDTCISRDPKGLYKKALKNEIKEFTGISSPYEPPESPELRLINNDEIDIKTNIAKVIEFLETKEIISST